MHYLDYELLRVITKIYATLRQIMADYGCYGNFSPLGDPFITVQGWINANANF